MFTPIKISSLKLLKTVYNKNFVCKTQMKNNYKSVGTIEF